MLFHTPLLRAINLSIAVLLIALAAAGYWFLWRPLPADSGTEQAPVSARATIQFDSLGVPHVAAATWQDAIFLQGYLTARDRMWQLDAMRRLAAGELAEVIGPAMLDLDRETRRFGLGRMADEQERLLTPQAREIYSEYARGVNYFLETHRDRLPVEFKLLNYDPRPWRIRDSVLIGLHMYRTLTPSWNDEIRKLHLIQKGDPQKVAYLYQIRDGQDFLPGSNAWVISGEHTASGKPILANDPHLEFSMPSTWYMVHLQAPGLDVTGVTLPGIPAVLIGHNQHIAWGLTNLGFDVQDLYREQINAQTGQYAVPGGSAQAVARREPIVVKGAQTADGITWITKDGPMFLADDNQTYALRWMAAVSPNRDFPFLDLDRASNWDEFNAALRRYAGPGQNFVYADTDGNIGYHVGGVLPIRKGCSGDVPSDGAQGGCEWSGTIPYDELPSVYNPPGGMIVTANQKPFPHGYPYPDDGVYAAPYRARQIRGMLGARKKWTPEPMLAVQKDVYSAPLRFLAQQVVEAWEHKKGSSEQMQEAVDLLRSWNGQMEKWTAAPLIAALLLPELQKAIAKKVAPEASEDDIAAVTTAAVEALLQQRPEGWFDNYDLFLLDSLQKALEAGGKLQGSKVSRWDYGQYLEWHVDSPVAGQIPLLGKYFNIGDVPMSGAGSTVKQTTRRLGPSMRMIVDLGNLEGSLENITVGESEHPLSPHYRDQWDAYYSGRSFPMQFGKIAAKSTLTILPH